MKYVIQYTLPYEHRVMVGIEAESRDEAIARANELFDQGDIWDDTPEVPLLFDDFEEQGDAGVPLEFTVEDEVSGDWPPLVNISKVALSDCIRIILIILNARSAMEKCGKKIWLTKIGASHLVVYMGDC
jgi:hypothetical protein